MGLPAGMQQELLGVFNSKFITAPSIEPQSNECAGHIQALTEAAWQFFPTSSTASLCALSTPAATPSPEKNYPALSTSLLKSSE